MRLFDFLLINEIRNKISRLVKVKKKNKQNKMFNVRTQLVVDWLDEMYLR